MSKERDQFFEDLSSFEYVKLRLEVREMFEAATTKADRRGYRYHNLYVSFAIRELMKERQRRREFEQCIREEFLLNSQNYPKEYHKLFEQKFARAERRFKEQNK